MSQNARQAQKPVILIICNYYLPGYKAGGGLRTLVNMVERFKHKFDFKIITLDHDGDEIPYDSVKIDQWNDLDDTQVFYLSKSNVRLSKIRELIKAIEPDAIYLNSVFSVLTINVLVLKKLKLIPQINIILAPEGELSEGALQLKAYRKKAFTSFSKFAGLYKNLIWKTTAEPEKKETEIFKGRGGQIFIAPNMPSKNLLTDYEQNHKPFKAIGEARMIFLSRYMRKKNFGWLVENLKNIEGKLEIDIYGAIEDADYWTQTQKNINNLPQNIQVKYKGLVVHEKVLDKIFEYHFFILPTLGENFGHVFIEATAAGCPLIISDRTPWLNLEEKKIGWDIPLEKPDEWIKILNQCINLDNESYEELSSNARSFACSWLLDPKIEADTLTVLHNGLSH